MNIAIILRKSPTKKPEISMELQKQDKEIRYEYDGRILNLYHGPSELQRELTLRISAASLGELALVVAQEINEQHSLKNHLYISINSRRNPVTYDPFRPISIEMTDKIDAIFNEVVRQTHYDYSWILLKDKDRYVIAFVGTR